MRKSLWLAIASMGLYFLSVNGFAQIYEENALSISRPFTGGTARIQSLGGAGIALGGDISAAHLNPAGLGFYNRSEVSFTPAFNLPSTSSTYLGNTLDDNKFNFNFQNLGVAINNPRGQYDGRAWKGGTFGISVSRTNDFQNQLRYEGANAITDFIDFAVDQDNLFGPNRLSDLAFNTFLTNEFFELNVGQETIFINGIERSLEELYGDNIPSDTLFFIDRNIFAFENGRFLEDENGNLIPALPNEDNPVIQQETIEQSGSEYQFNLSYGGNVSDKFYFGASLGVITLRKEITRTYQETPSNADLTNFVLFDDYELTGVGVNGTFGVIYRPATPVLIGITYNTPSFYSLEESSIQTLTANFFDETISSTSEQLPFSYNMHKPGKVKGGLTYFFGKNGFITGDVEYSDFSNLNYSGADGGESFEQQNENIESLFKSGVTYRIGGEYRINIFRLRAGYAHLASPLQDDLDRDIEQVSFGAGVRTDKFYLDLGALQSFQNESLIGPYPGSPSAVVENQATRITLTAGFFF